MSGDGRHETTVLAETGGNGGDYYGPPGHSALLSYSRAVPAAVCKVSPCRLWLCCMDLCTAIHWSVTSFALFIV